MLKTRAAILLVCVAASALDRSPAAAQAPDEPPPPEPVELPAPTDETPETTTIADTGPTPTLESARELYFTAQFEAAHAELRAITASPTLTREDLVEALRYLVTLELMLGHPTEATGCARALLALDPEATLPEGSPDNAIATFERLRGGARASQLELTLTETRASVALTPTIGVLPTLRLSCAGGTPPTLEGRSAVALEVSLDPLVVASCDAEALSPGGAAILTTHGERPASPPPPVIETPVVVDTGEGDLLPWIAIGAGSVAAVAIIVTIVAVVATQDGPSTALPSPTVVGW